MLKDYNKATLYTRYMAHLEKMVKEQEERKEGEIAAAKKEESKKEELDYEFLSDLDP